MSFDANDEAIFRRAPTYVDKIPEGTRPADLPVELPSRSVVLRATRIVS